MRSAQTGSQARVAADWDAGSRDRFDLLGLGLQYQALPDI